MKNIREIIATNIIQLRKTHDLTQKSFAEKINYSDKAVSRWEKGEVVPDIETLQVIADCFEVPITKLLEENDLQVDKKQITRNELLSQILFVFEIWTIISVLYVYMNVAYNQNLWKTFLLGIPISAFILLLFNLNKSNIAKFVYGTIFTWSLLICGFVFMLPVIAWYVFIIGLPMQGILILKYLFKVKQKNILLIKPFRKFKAKKDKDTT